MRAAEQKQKSRARPELSGDVDMGARIMAYDWSRTALGPRTSWPQSLQTAINLCLYARSAMAICWGPDLILLYNDAFRSILGGDKHPQALGSPSRAVWPEIWDLLGPILSSVMASGRATASGALLAERPDAADQASFSWSFSPLYDETGETGGVVTEVTPVFLSDISERKRAEQALKISENRLRMAVEAGAIGIWDIDLQTGTRVWSTEAKAIYGLAAHEPMDYQRQLSLIHPEDRDRVHSLVTEFRDEGTRKQLHFEHRILRTDGSLRWAVVRGEAIYDGGALPIRLIGTIIDITERKQAEERLQLLQAITTRLAMALTVADVVTTVLEQGLPALGSIIGSVVQLNGDQVEIIGTLGYPDAITRPWLRFPLASNNPFSEVLRTGSALWIETLDTFQQRYPGLNAPASLAIAKSWAILPLIVDGQTFGVLGMGYAQPQTFDLDSRRFATTLADMSAQALERARLYEAERRARAELLERERHMHLALEAARMITWTWDLREDRIRTTDNFASVYGLDMITTIAQGVALIHPDDKERHQQAVRQAVETHSGYHSEFRIIRPDTGQTVWLEERAVPLLDANGQMKELAGVVIDITERKYSEEISRMSEARYRHLANAMPQLVWTSTPDGVLDYYNSRVAEYAGIVRTEEGSWDWQLVVHPDELQRTLEAWQDALRNGQQYTCEHRIQMKDGEFRWHLSRAIPAQDLDGNIIKWFGTATNIDQQYRSAQDARCLADIGEIIRLNTDAQTMLSRLTRVLGEYLHVRRCMVIEIDLARNLGIILQQHCRGVPPVAPEYQLTEYSESAQVEIDTGRTIVNNDSQIDPRTAAIYATTYQPHGERAYVAVPLMRDGKRNGTLWVSDDLPRQWSAREVVLLETVAERVWLAIEKLRAEQALRANEERLQILYIQEQAARTQAETANRLKDEFLMTVSHELRTPLTSILGYGQMIQARYRNEPYIARTIEKIVRSAKAQAQLIDDLLDVTRIVTGKLRIEPRTIDMSVLIQTAIETLRPAIDAKGIRLELDLHAASSIIIGDPNRLQQVVWNLVANAVKFTPSGGSVRVRFVRHAGHVRVIVSDTGQGISTEFLPYVFDRFRQAESTSTRAHGGLGLGLSIVRHLVESHGGTVQVESPGLGQGATFTVYLPTIREEAAEQQEGPNVLDVGNLYPPELRGLRVLVVDDQQDILELLDSMLTPCGVVLRASTSALAALEILREWQPDVLVSDIAMPGEDGYWLIRNLRALAPEQGGTIPALALTAYVRLEDRMHVLAAGFQLYIPKPVDTAELLDAIARLATA